MTGLASYGDRVAAWLIDSVIVYGVAIGVLAIIIAVYLPDTVDSEPGQTGLGFVLVPIVPLYSALLQGLWHGQTVGKRCLGIAVRIARRSRDPPRPLVRAVVHESRHMALLPGLDPRLALAALGGKTPRPA